MDPDKMHVTSTEGNYYFPASDFINDTICTEFYRRLKILIANYANTEFFEARDIGATNARPGTAITLAGTCRLIGSIARKPKLPPQLLKFIAASAAAPAGNPAVVTSQNKQPRRSKGDPLTPLITQAIKRGKRDTAECWEYLTEVFLNKPNTSAITGITQKNLTFTDADGRQKTISRKNVSDRLLRKIKSMPSA